MNESTSPTTSLDQKDATVTTENTADRTPRPQGKQTMHVMFEKAREMAAQAKALSDTQSGAADAAPALVAEAAPEDAPDAAGAGMASIPLAAKTARLGRLVHRYFAASAHAHGAAGNPLRGQGRVLTLLKNKPETTQRELSYVLDMRQQSLSEILAKLEEKGYVTRRRSESDGRVTIVRLTEAGAAAAPDVEAMASKADPLAVLSQEERELFEASVDKVTASIEDRLRALGIDPNAHPARIRRDMEGGPDHGRGRRGPGAAGPQRGPHGRGPRGHGGPGGFDAPDAPGCSGRGGLDGPGGDGPCGPQGRGRLRLGDCGPRAMYQAQHGRGARDMRPPRMNKSR